MCRRNSNRKVAVHSLDDVLAKLQALAHEPAPPSADPERRLARREAIRLMLNRLRGEEANPCRD
eukprot:13154626-Alexandrium_andersonii.AAC.1